MVKNPPARTGDTRDVGLIPGSGRSPGEGNGNPLQYSCLENPMDRGAMYNDISFCFNLNFPDYKKILRLLLFMFCFLS